MIEITSKYLASQRLSSNFQQRFWPKLIKSDGCWIWNATMHATGYGTINRGKPYPGLILSHRASWIINMGPIPYGMHVLHNCPGGDNRACVRPDHLWLGTDLENQRDSVKKGTHHCLRIGEFAGERNGCSKLRWKDIDWLRQHYSGAYGQISAFARMFSVSRRTIQFIVQQKHWLQSFHP